MTSRRCWTNAAVFLNFRRIMQMRGRIDQSMDANEDTKRPIILPREHAITKLLINVYHIKYHHLQHETVLNEIRQKFF